MERAGFTFYRSMFETAADFVDEEEQDLVKRQAEADALELAWYRAIFNFIFNGEEPNLKNRELKIAWRNVLPVLIKSNNLARAGAVKTNQSESIEINQNQLKSIENQTRVFETDKEKEGISLFVNNIKIFNKGEGECQRAPLRTTEEREPYYAIFSDFFSVLPANFKEDADEIVDTIIQAAEEASSPEGLKFDGRLFDGKGFAEALSKLTSNNFQNVFTAIHFCEPGRIKKRPAYILQCLIEQARQNTEKRKYNDRLRHRMDLEVEEYRRRKNERN